MRIDEDNPFRESGQLSQYASEVVNAVKGGNLKQLDNSCDGEPEQEEEHQTCDNDSFEVEASVETKNSSGTKDILVEHCVVISPKHTDIEHILINKKKPNYLSCCIIL